MNNGGDIPLKDIIFMIYSAGYEAGYGEKRDLAISFEEYYKILEKTVEESK